MNITEANAVNQVLHWAMGHRVAYAGGPRITDEDATKAAKLLATRAEKVLSAELGPDDVELRRTQWWIATAPLVMDGEKVLGPFGTQELALEVRRYVEKTTTPRTYWVDSEDVPDGGETP